MGFSLKIIDKEPHTILNLFAVQYIYQIKIIILKQLADGAIKKKFLNIFFKIS